MFCKVNVRGPLIVSDLALFCSIQSKLTLFDYVDRI